ncbi:MAG: M23 family metallopeptidase [Anaerolineales bacterium]|jgi:hypothetical protein|nr:M23 family metallopeptidase [Chloroflexota bacterium]MBK6646317.1 M23 family metallopeptidase [Anaerolineales bacterium]MCC6986264.1 M23 family metallopeptidase [Anaerolineales bacterium]
MAFRSPVGTEDERNKMPIDIWPKTWVDANAWTGNIPPKYLLGKGNWAYHTGADLNMAGDKDAHAPIYSIGDGVVRFAQLVSKTTWGNLVVINHGIVNGKPLFSRYGHVEDMLVAKGQAVKAGDPIAKVGNQFGVFPYHLHFDISTTIQLDKSPTYWPGLDLQSCRHHFVNPRNWLRENHNNSAEKLPDGLGTSGGGLGTNGGTKPDDVKPLPTWYVIDPQGAQVYKEPSLAAEKTVLLPRGTKVTVDVQKGRKDAALTWGPIIGGNLNGQWVAIRKNDGKESYLSTNPPQ